MKKLFKSVVAMLMIGAMAMTVGCKEYDDDINDINNRLDELTTGTVATTAQQVVAIQQSLKTLTETTIPQMQLSLTNLGKEDAAIRLLIQQKETELTTAIGDAKTALQNQITDLKTAKTLIEGRITSLETTLGDTSKGLVKKVNDIGASLANYETMEHAAATYATAAKHQALSDDVDQMKRDYATIAKMNEELAKYVKAEDLPALVSGELKAAMDDATSDLNKWLGKALEDALAAYVSSDDLAETLALYYTKDEVLATYTKANADFKAGVDECIAAALENNGAIDKVIAAKIKDVTDKYDAILKSLRIDVDKLMSRLQSIAYVPTTASGKAYVTYLDVVSNATGVDVHNVLGYKPVDLTFKVRPADAAADLADAWAADNTIFSILVQAVDATRGDGYAPAMKIKDVKGDATTGNIIVSAVPDNFNPAFCLNDASNGMYSVALAAKYAVEADAENNISAKDVDVTSDYVNLRSEKYGNVSCTVELWYNTNIITGTLPSNFIHELEYNDLEAKAKLAVNPSNLSVVIIGIPGAQPQTLARVRAYFGFDLPDAIMKVEHSINRTNAVDPTAAENFAYENSFTEPLRGTTSYTLSPYYIIPSADGTQDVAKLKAVDKKSVGQVDNATIKLMVPLPYKTGGVQTAWTVHCSAKTTIVKASSDFKFTAVDKYWKYAERNVLDKINVAATEWTNTATVANGITNAQLFGDNNNFSDFVIYDAADAAKTNLIGTMFSGITFNYAAAAGDAPETITYSVAGQTNAKIAEAWDANKTYAFSCKKTLSGDDVIIEGSFKPIGLPNSYSDTLFPAVAFTYANPTMSATSTFVAPTSDTYTDLMKHFTEAEFCTFLATTTPTYEGSLSKGANTKMVITYVGTPAVCKANLGLDKSALTAFDNTIEYHNDYVLATYKDFTVHALTDANTITTPAYKVRNVKAFCDKGADWNSVFKEVSGYDNYWGVSLGQYAPNSTKPNTFSLATVKLEDLFEVLDLNGSPIAAADLAGRGFTFKYKFNDTAYGAATIAGNILDYKYKEGGYVTLKGELYLDNLLLPAAYTPATGTAYSPFRVYAQKPIATQALGNGIKAINVQSGETGTETAYAYAAMSLKDKRGAELIDATATAMASAWITGGDNFADTFTSSVVYGGLSITFGDFKLYYDAAHTEEATNINPVTFNKATGVITYDKASLVALGRPLYMVINPVTVTNKWCVINSASVEFQFIPQK